MSRLSSAHLLVCFLSVGILVGCTDSGGRTADLAEASGIVTFQNAPLSGATVTFVPENGPLAIGVTDDAGKFTLMSGSRRGAAIGKAKVSIRAATAAAESSSAPTTSGPPSTDAEKKAFMARTTEMMKTQGQGDTKAAGPKSLIPEKFGSAETSGLTAEVSSDASKNTFEFKL